MNETAERWLAFADEDLRVAEAVMPQELYNQVCFHAQQCVEKSLKSLLAMRGQRLPRTHAITDLLVLLPAEMPADLQDDLSSMDDYYIPTRYPDALPGSFPESLPGKEEAGEALLLARRVFERAKQLIRD